MLQIMTENTTKTRSSGDEPSKLPARSARDLEDLGRAISALAAVGHERMTVKQSLFFITVAFAHAMGRSVTLSQIQEEAGSLSGSVRKSYQVFLEKTKRDPDNLGWIYQERDEDDRRVNYLKLTKTGVSVASAIAEAMRG